MTNEKEVRQALQGVIHPSLKKSLVDLGMIRDIIILGQSVELTLALKAVQGPLRNRFVSAIEKILKELPGIAQVSVKITTLNQEEIEQLFPTIPLKGIEKVRHFYAVASGKGGVGKTTVAVNLALAFARNGFRTGLLDADVYGPSVPLMLALPNSLEEKEGMILPREKFGLRVVSLGMTAGETDAFIWRGPLVSKMIRHLLERVNWGDLDYLVIDLPPGTGDPSITIAQSIPQSSILIVTTPQEVSLIDVRRSITLFQKHNLHIAGLVENMSSFRCSHSAQPIEIFGHGGGEKLSRESGLPLLAQIPFDLELGRSGDNGMPLLVSAPDSETSRIFLKVASELAAQTAEVAR